MASTEERDHSIVHLDRERYERDPGDYYDNKAARASVLREALAAVETKLAKATCPDARAILHRQARGLREALERAEYVGD